LRGKLEVDLSEKLNYGLSLTAFGINDEKPDWPVGLLKDILFLVPVKAPPGVSFPESISPSESNRLLVFSYSVTVKESRL
jgi:hypothetical protein